MLCSEVVCHEECVHCHEAFVHQTCPLERRFLCVVLFLMGTFISKSASREAGEEVLSVVGDEMEFHEGRVRFCAACSCSRTPPPHALMSPLCQLRRGLILRMEIPI